MFTNTETILMDCRSQEIGLVDKQRNKGLKATLLYVFGPLITSCQWPFGTLGAYPSSPDGGGIKWRCNSGRRETWSNDNTSIWNP